MNACTKGHKDVVKLLLKYPKVVDIKIPDNFQISEEIQSLIDMHSMTASVCTPWPFRSGIDLNARDFLGNTALMLAYQ